MKNQTMDIMKKILKRDEIREIDFIVCLMGCTSYVFAHPETLNSEDQEILRQAYIQLEKTGTSIP